MTMDGTYLQGITTVLHDWTQVDFANFIYSAVKFGVTDGNSVIINGNSMVKVAGVTVNILVDYNTTELGDTGDDVYFLGNPRPTFSDNIKGGVDEYISKYSMYFDFDDSQWINCGSDASLQNITGDFTASIWANPDLENPTGDGYIFDNYSAGDGWALFLDRPDRKWNLRLGVQVGPSAFKDGGSLADVVEANEWTHVVSVWNNTTKEIKIYINGELNNTTTLAPPNTLLASGDIFRIGAGSSNTTEFFGFLNNGAVWGAALTDDEVLEVFNGGIPMDLNLDAPQRASLISWWKLGDDASWDGTDWHIPDQVGINNGISDVGGGAGADAMDWDNRKINAPQLDIDA
jgi:hypothetical protein